MPWFHSCLEQCWLRAGRSLDELSLTVWLGLGLAAAGSLLLAGSWPSRWAKWQRTVLWSTLSIAVALGVAHAFTRRWLSAEAFITLRYADHLIQGSGLVFNPGERVAGYPSLLGVLVVALFRRLGLAAGAAVQAVGLGSHAATLALVGTHVARHPPDRHRVGVALAPLWLAGISAFVGFGTGDAETMLGTALVFAALERMDRGRAATAGVAAALAAWCGSDFWLLAVALGLTTLGLRPGRFATRYFVAGAAVLLPGVVFCWLYFGDPIPERFFFWSGASFYGSQAFAYLTVSILDGAVVCLVPLVLIGYYHQRFKHAGRFLAIAAPLHVLYVVWIGGDYLAHRLLVPLLPVALLLAEIGLRHGLSAGAHGTPPRDGAIVERLGGRAVTGLAAVLGMGASIPHLVLDPGTELWKVSALPDPGKARTPAEAVAPWAGANAAFGSIAPPVLVAVNDPATAYALDTDVILLSAATDRTIARSPLAERGRPGHEKLAASDYLLAAGADLSEWTIYPEPYGAATMVRLGTQTLYLGRYRPAVVEAVNALSEAPVVSAEALVDRFRVARSPWETACSRWFLERFLLDPADPVTRAALVERLGLPPREAELLATPRGTLPRGWTPISRLDLSTSEASSWLRTGLAFGRGPATRTDPAQGARLPHELFVNSYHPRERDASRGILQSPPFAIDGQVMTLEVAGGMDGARLHVDLVVDDQWVAKTATGCNSEVFHRVTWDTTTLVGRSGRLVLTDDSTEAWGHLMVSAIRQYAVDPNGKQAAWRP